MNVIMEDLLVLTKLKLLLSMVKLRLIISYFTSEFFSKTVKISKRMVWIVKHTSLI